MIEITGSRLGDKNKHKATFRGSRRAAFQLVNQLLESDPTLLPDFISGQVAAVVGEIPRPKHNDMRVDASDEDGQKFCGLENLQNICYMNSVMQQLFMTQAIRYNVLGLERSEE